MNASVQIPALQLGAILDQKAPGQAGTVMVPLYEEIQDVQNQVAAASWAVSHTIYVGDNAPGAQGFVVVAASARFGTASSSGTLQVEVAAAGVAVGSGTNQLTGTISLAGTANTTVNGTVIAAPTTLSAGKALNLIFAGTVTSLANCTVTVALQRIS